MRTPRVAEALLQGFVADPGLEEAILGDLVEEGNERAAGPGPGPGRAWYWEQVLRSVPHLLRAWWLENPARALRAAGRAAVVVAISLASATLVVRSTGGGGSTGLPLPGDPHALAVEMLLAGAIWAAAGGLFLAWRADRAPMCPVALLGLAWIPAALVPSAIFPPPGPPTWFPVAFPALLLALTVVGGAVATTLRGARHRRSHLPGDTDPSNPEVSVKKVKIAYRLAARPILAAAVLLMVPLVAMQLTDEVVWTLSDFVFMGALIFGTGFAFELALKTTADTAYRWAVGVALAAGFLLIWITGAVGIIGSEANSANLMYAGVLAVGISGAFVARFRPRGMARAMVAAASVQALIAVIAIGYGLGRPYSGAVELALLNGFWVALFAVSARLFQAAARERSSREKSTASSAGAGATG